MASHAQIAGAVHEAVCEVTGTDGFQRCLEYAWSGAVIAQTVTGKPHTWQAGSAAVFIADDDDGGAPYYLGLGPGDGYTGASNGDLHCWFGEVPAGARAGETLELKPGELVVADLSLRHFRTNAEKLGLPWNRDPLPDYCWDTMAAIQSQLRVRYSPDWECMEVVTAALKANARWHQDITRNALRRLGVRP